jgi:hypothetical protein
MFTAAANAAEPLAKEKAARAQHRQIVAFCCSNKNRGEQWIIRPINYKLKKS